jgi:peptide/nickel transport system ATP-binding protein
VTLQDLEKQCSLAISGLDVTYGNGIHAVRGVDLDVGPGRCLGLVGESGSGKSTIVLSVLGLLPKSAIVRGSITVGGDEVVGSKESRMRRLRGRTLGLVAQDPMASFDPLMSVAGSVAEAWRVHHLRPRHQDVDQSLEHLGIDDAHARARLRPHMWSGGMLQRAAIAAASAHTPSVIIADEPTSALDADRADSILATLRSTSAAILLVSHDLDLVARHSDEVAVMYAGEVIERGDADQVLHRPRHPYARALLEATPRPGHGLPKPLYGAPPQLDVEICGCPFAPRCENAQPVCATTAPDLVEGVACWEAV